MVVAKIQIPANNEISNGGNPLEIKITVTNKIPKFSKTLKNDAVPCFPPKTIIKTANTIVNAKIDDINQPSFRFKNREQRKLAVGITKVIPIPLNNA